MSKGGLDTRQMILCALFTALIAVGAQIKVPLPVVPFTLQFLFTTLAGLLLGGRLGALSVAVYLVLGLVGAPVFTEGGGPAYLLKPSFGYLIGFIPMAVIAGIFIEKSGRKLVLGMIGMILGTAVCYIFGTVWFVLVMKTSVQAALTMCVYPFIVFDIIKMVLAAWIGPQIHGRLVQAGLL